MKSEDVVGRRNILNGIRVLGDDWVNNVVETITQTKDILQSVYLKRYLLRAMMAGFYYRYYYGLRAIS